MKASEVWGRLATQITDECGLAVTVDSKRYQEMRHGRPSSGVSYGITHKLPSGHVLCIRDAWWRKNPDVWIGYTIDIEDREGIVVRHWRPTKKRSEVVAAVHEALQRVSA